MKVKKEPAFEINPDTGKVIGESTKTTIDSEFEDVKVKVTIKSPTDEGANDIYSQCVNLCRAFEDGTQLTMELDRDPAKEAVEGFDENGMPTA